MNEENKQQSVQWLRPQDVKVWRTSDPKEMLNNFTAEVVKRTWTEELIDEKTGEKVPVEHNEVVLSKGILLDKDAIQTVMFHIQAHDIDNILVADHRNQGAIS